MIHKVVEEFERYDIFCRKDTFKFNYNKKDRLVGVIEFFYDSETGQFNMNNANSERNTGAYFVYKYLTDFTNIKQRCEIYDNYFSNSREKALVDQYFEVRIFEVKNKLI
jgi:hypothetical protein